VSDVVEEYLKEVFTNDGMQCVEVNEVVNEYYNLHISKMLHGNFPSESCQYQTKIAQKEFDGIPLETFILELMQHAYNLGKAELEAECEKSFQVALSLSVEDFMSTENIPHRQQWGDE
jgi:hypothetical protein